MNQTGRILANIPFEEPIPFMQLAQNLPGIDHGTLFETLRTFQDLEMAEVIWSTRGKPEKIKLTPLGAERAKEVLLHSVGER